MAPKKTKQSLITFETTTEHEKNKFPYSPGEHWDGNVLCDIGHVLLTWNVPAFQILMDKDYLFDDVTMYTFLQSVYFKYPNSGFAFDDKQILPENQLESLLENEDLMIERTKQFEDVQYVCRIMVSGSDNMNVHYQVLVINRKKRQVFVIEHAKGIPLSMSQKKQVKNVLKSFGWVKNPTLTDYEENVNKSRWLLKHIASHKRGSDEFLSPACGPFACLVLYLCFSQAKNLETFDPSTIMLNDDEEGCQMSELTLSLGCLRKDFLRIFRKTLLPYVDNCFQRLKSLWQQTGQNSKEDLQLYYYTQGLLKLNEYKFFEALSIEEPFVCKNPKEKPTYIFIPSCCFRSYHPVCYLTYIWKRLSDEFGEQQSWPGISPCPFCLRSERVVDGVCHAGMMCTEEVVTLEQELKPLFKQFWALMKYDVESKYIATKYRGQGTKAFLMREEKKTKECYDFGLIPEIAMTLEEYQTGDVVVEEQPPPCFSISQFKISVLFHARVKGKINTMNQEASVNQRRLEMNRIVGSQASNPIDVDACDPVSNPKQTDASSLFSSDSSESRFSNTIYSQRY